MAIKPVSQNNNFEQWVYTTRSLIDVSNSLTDGNINAYIVSANSRSIQAYDFANTVNVRVQSLYDFANTVNTFIWNTKANVDASYVKVNAVWDYTNTVNIHSQSLYDSVNLTKTNVTTTYHIANTAYNYANTFYQPITEFVPITFIGSATSNTGTIQLPSGLQTGDHIFLLMGSDSVTPSLLSGWTNIKTGVNDSAYHSLQYKKIGIPVDTQITTQTNMASVAMIFRGDINVVDKGFQTGSGAESSSPTVTINSGDVVSNGVSLIFAVLDDDAVASSVVAPSGYTLVNTSQSLVTNYVATLMAAYASYPVTPGNYSFSTSGFDQWVSLKISLEIPSVVSNVQISNNATNDKVATAYSFANSVNNIAVPLFEHTNAGFIFANTVNIRSDSSNSLISKSNVSSISLFDKSNTVNIMVNNVQTLVNTDVTNINLTNKGAFGYFDRDTSIIQLDANGRISNIMTQRTGVSVNIKSENIELDDYLIFSTVNSYTLSGILGLPFIFGNTSTSNNTTTLNWPSGKQTGDVVFVASVRDDGLGGPFTYYAPSAPTGFTEIYRNSFTNGSGEGWFCVSYRIINGSEAGTISGLHGTDIAHIAIGVRNCGTSIVVDAYSVNRTNTTSVANGTFNAPDVLDITTVRENSGLLAFGFIDNNPAIFNSGPSGYTYLGNSIFGSSGTAASVGAAFATAKNIGVQSPTTFNITQSNINTGSAGATGSIILALRGASISPVTIRQNVVSVNATSIVTYNANNRTVGTINVNIKNGITENVYTQNTDSLTVLNINPSIHGKYQNLRITKNSTITDNLNTGDSSLLAIRNPYANTITWPTITWLSNTTPNLSKVGVDIVSFFKANSTFLIGNHVGNFYTNTSSFVGTPTNSTTTSITLPTGLQANDIVVIASFSDLGTVTQTVPSGYTLGQSGTGLSSQLSYQWAYKIMGETPDTTATGIAPGSLSIAFAIRGIGESIFDVSVPAVATGSTLMPNPPSVTTVSRGVLNIVIGYLDDDIITATAPTNYTLITSANYNVSSNTGTIMAASRFLSNPTSEDPGSFGVGSGTGDDYWVAATIPFIIKGI